MPNRSRLLLLYALGCVIGACVAIAVRGTNPVADIAAVAERLDGRMSPLEPAALRSPAASDAVDASSNIDVSRAVDASPAVGQTALADDTATPSEERLSAAFADGVNRWVEVPRLAKSFGRVDPSAAFALRSVIPAGDLRRTYSVDVLHEWALLDAAGALDALAALDPAEFPRDTWVYLQLAASEPLRLSALSAAFPPQDRAQARRAVVEVLAARDPLAALEHLEGWNPSRDERTEYRRIVATQFGRRDPAAALAWLERLGRSPGTPRVDDRERESLSNALFAGIAAADFEFALDRLVDSIARGEPASSLVQGVVSSGVTSDEMQRLVERLLAVVRPGSADVLSGPLLQWASADPPRAVEWLLSTGSRVPRQLIDAFVSNVATSDPELAVRAAGRVQDSLRREWLAGIARGIGRNDPQRAANLLLPFAADLGLDAVIGEIVKNASSTDPAGAARLLDLASDDTRQIHASRLAADWGQRDAPAAARWVQSLPDGEPKYRALNGLASSWARRDSASALRWTATLPSSGERDRALEGVVSGAAVVGHVDADAFAAFDAPEARRSAIRTVVSTLSSRYPEKARELIESLAEDPAFQRELSRLIDGLELSFH